ncbi:uncharacterized protein DUF1490 [Williamsia limnetica]|jgi:hypothetical protein|uniref:Uncharacterized protein DUF1490 n=1 Tax=Williamsia limnetica TaxID=882452 RepID=A0A318RKQ3_WILLI|nr:DUF1490 family protein [Williamsia limnetica]PYE16461.1 uncharacterized protein DUF1490 [Williamsia limnetica]
MVFGALLGKAAATVVTGAVGVAAYNGTRELVRRAPLREAAVTATAWSLRGVRKAEEGAESARLAAADVVAEAKEKIGEQVTPPVATPAHDHEH